MKGLPIFFDSEGKNILLEKKFDEYFCDAVN